MNYLRIYIQLIGKRRQFPINKNKKQSGEVEYHHIIPIKCNGVPTIKAARYNQFGTNLIGLTVKEHFIAHHLLVKIYQNTEYEQAALTAFAALAYTRNDNITKIKNKIKITARLFSILRKNASLIFQKRRKDIIPWNKGKKTGKPSWNSGKKTGKPAWNSGKKMPPSYSEMMSKIIKGSRYITNGVILKRIKQNDPLPNGFHYGRK